MYIYILFLCVCSFVYACKYSLRWAQFSKYSIEIHLKYIYDEFIYIPYIYTVRRYIYIYIYFKVHTFKYLMRLLSNSVRDTCCALHPSRLVSVF